MPGRLLGLPDDCAELSSICRLTGPALKTKSITVAPVYSPYLFPFGLFAVLTYAGALLHLPMPAIYPLKTFLVAVSLVWLWKYYGSEIRAQWDFLAVLAGGAVFFVWVGLEGWYPPLGGAAVSSASEFSYQDAGIIFIAIRMIGAVLIVPVMEEIFWRSFAMRFLIDSRFKSIELGKYTWFSFLVVAVAFGLEHQRWLPGIIAGMVYAGVLYRTKNLFSPILAHAVTNLLLGIYVLQSGRFGFW